MIERAMRRSLFAVIGFAWCALSYRSAAAYCRTTTCTDCFTDREGCTVGGTAISWPQSCVSFSVQKDGSRIADYATVEQLAHSAFNQWQNAACGSGGDAPSITLADAFGPVICDQHEYNIGRGNANAIMFHDDVWPYGDNVFSILALTTVTFDKNTGDIHDADLEINGTQPLSTDTPVPSDKFDLRSILVHEAGHFLGLAHSLDPDSVMRASYLPGDDSFRRLGSDDEAGICAIYVPNFPATVCDFTPRYGFSPDCAIRVSSGQGCAFSPFTARSPGAAWLWPIALLAALAGARRTASKHDLESRRRRDVMIPHDPGVVAAAAKRLQGKAKYAVGSRGTQS
jgi:hypothetical protein